MVVGVEDEATGTVGGEGGTLLLAGPALREAEKLAGEAASAKFGDDVEAFDVADLDVGEPGEVESDGELHHGDSLAMMFGEEDGLGLRRSSREERGNLRTMVGGTVGPMRGAQAFPASGIGGGNVADADGRIHKYKSGLGDRRAHDSTTCLQVGRYRIADLKLEACG